MTASAPTGIGAPVMMLIVKPGATVCVGTDPAVTNSMTRSVWAGSLEITANPSTSDLSNGGESTSLVTSSASRRPSKSFSCNGTGGNAAAWRPTATSASATESMAVQERQDHMIEQD